MSTEYLLLITAVVISIVACIVSWTVFSKAAKKLKNYIHKPGDVISPQREYVENKVFTAAEPLTKDIGFLTDSNHLLLDVSAHKEMVIRTKLPDFSFYEEMAINLSEIEVNEKLVACLMPFNRKFDPIKNTISETCSSMGYMFRRSDDILIEDNTDLRKSIVRMILEARVIVAVLDGRNPNVYYEIGLAHSMGKLVLLVANLNREDTKKLPTDVLSNRLITYNNLAELKERLTKTLQAIHYDD